MQRVDRMKKMPFPLKRFKEKADRFRSAFSFAL